MITRAIKSQIDQIWNAFWSGGISNPLEVIEHVFPFLRTLGGDESTYAHHMKDARFTMGKEVARTAPAGSILVTCIAGSPQCIGQAAMTDREVAFNQQINALVPVHCDAHFLYAQLISAKRLIQQASTLAMKGIVSKSRLAKLMLMCPAVSLQRLFSSRVIAIAKLKSTNRASLAELDALFASLQHRAFRGEL